ncbi:MAG: ATP-binding protein, partial [Candidatus Omnitrophica bacterium]|nr:ATP-binding protein [Candidatus Omnitrophota bacterium]
VMAMKDVRYIPREIEKTLRSSIDHFPAIALTGPRQSGKSTLARNLFEKTHTFISFDDPITRERAISDPELLIETAGEKIIFDEIQYAPQILSYIKMLIDKKRNKYGRFIITGSQQFHLIKNLGDTLAGRIALFDLLSFSMYEKKQAAFLKKTLSDTKSYFEHCCLRGSYPEMTVHPDADATTWYGAYLQTYLERDIRTIYNIGNLREFQQFLRLLAGRCSQVLNLSDFSSDLGVSVNTVKKWISILEASRIIYILPPYYRNLGKRITKSPKVYFLDIGLACYLTGLKSSTHVLNGPLAGALFENFVIQETVKYFFNRGLQPRLFYLRTHNNLEIDLIIEDNLQLYPFEIKLAKTLNKAMAAPLERFPKVFSKLKIKDGSIISLCEDEIALTRYAKAVTMDSYIKTLGEIEKR